MRVKNCCSLHVRPESFSIDFSKYLEGHEIKKNKNISYKIKQWEEMGKEWNWFNRGVRGFVDEGKKWERGLGWNQPTWWFSPNHRYHHTDNSACLASTHAHTHALLQWKFPHHESRYRSDCCVQRLHSNVHKHISPDSGTAKLQER